MTFGCAIALAAGGAAGYAIKTYFNLPYIELRLMNKYTGIDPGLVEGARVMDASWISFSEGSKLKTNMTMGFKEIDVHCIAL